MTPCEHTAFVHESGGRVLCYWCGLVFRGPATEEEAQKAFAFYNPTPRDEVDAFIATTEGDCQMIRRLKECAILALTWGALFWLVMEVLR